MTCFILSCMMFSFTLFSFSACLKGALVTPVKTCLNTLAWGLLLTDSIENLMKSILTCKLTHKILYAISKGSIKS